MEAIAGGRRAKKIPTIGSRAGSIGGRRERSARSKRQACETFPHQVVGCRVRMQCVRKGEFDGVLLSIECAAVQVVQVRVFRRPLANDAVQFIPDHAKGELSGGTLGGVSGCSEPELPGREGLEIECAGTRGVLMDRAVDGRYDQQWCLGMSVADGVEETVDGRSERAKTHQVEIDEVDTDLQADQFGGRVADGACRELVEERASAKAEIGQIGAAQTPGDRRPNRRRTGCIGPVTDRAAVMEPSGPPGRRRGFHWSVGAKRNDFRRLVVREPEFDVLGSLGEAQEPTRARGAGRTPDG